MDDLLKALCAIAEHHCPADRCGTAIPGLTLYRVGRDAPPGPTTYNPRICVVLRGAKTVSLGNERFEANPNVFLLVTVDLPVIAQSRIAANGENHIGLILELDRILLAEVLETLPLRLRPATAPGGLIASTMDADLLEAFARLLRLLDRPDDVAFVKALVLREIYFRLLRSDLQNALVQLATSGSRLSQIAKATNWIKSHYTEPMSIEALAALAGMSVTSFHRHFKRITLMTPLQYRTRIRLQAARRILLSKNQTAGSVGLTVGYDSHSQFSRDYKRLFGAPPAMHAARYLEDV
jgi:AraC-like DNA-binding protein